MKTKIEKVNISQLRIKQLIKDFNLTTIPSYYGNNGIGKISNKELLYEYECSCLELNYYYNYIRNLILYHSKICDQIEIENKTNELFFVFNFFQIPAYHVFKNWNPDDIYDYDNINNYEEEINEDDVVLNKIIKRISSKPIVWSKEYESNFKQTLENRNTDKLKASDEERLKAIINIIASQDYLRDDKSLNDEADFTIIINYKRKNYRIYWNDFGIIDQWMLKREISEAFIKYNIKEKITFDNNTPQIKLTREKKANKPQKNLKDIFIINLLNGIKKLNIEFKQPKTKNPDLGRRIGQNYFLFDLLKLLTWEFSYEDCKFFSDLKYDEYTYFEEYVDRRIRTILNSKNC